MTSDGDALFRAVCENPADDTPRLVYADWLEENGRAERAEFIRLQCNAWNLCPQYPTVREARTRASQLQREHGDAWYAELPAVPGVAWSALFVRGFVDAAWVRGSAATFLPSGRRVPGQTIPPVADVLNRVFAATPLRRLKVEGFTGRQVGQLLTHPLLGRLAKLNLSGAEGVDASLVRETRRRCPKTEIY